MSESAIYIRYNGQIIIANYYNDIYGNRMISRASNTIEYLRSFLTKGWDWFFTSKISIGMLKLLIDTDFGSKEVVIGKDLLEEYRNIVAEGKNLDISDYLFSTHDDTNGHLYIDVYAPEDLPFYDVSYCFYCSSEDRIMDASEYLRQRCPDYRNTMDEDQLRCCNENIKAISDMSVLMTPDEAKDFRAIKTI